MKNTLLLLLILLFSGCFVTKEVQVEQPSYSVRHVEQFASKGDAPGVFYALPRSVINIDFEISRKDYVKGPYAQYASKFLGLGNIPLANSSSFEISGIKVSTYAEPDPEQYYFIEMPDDYPMILELSESGLILGFNKESGAKDVQSGYFREMSESKEVNDKTNVLLTDFNLTEQIDTVVEYISIDTLQIPSMVVRRTMVEKSLEQKAKDAADEIFRLQESKMNLLTGFQEVSYAYETFKYMYDQLDQMEQELTKLFTGSVYTSRRTFRYVMTPNADVFEINNPIFRFSRQQGIMQLDQSNGDAVTINLVRSTNNLLLSEFAATQPSSKQSGIVYRIPEYGKLSIFLGKELKAESKILIGQFGVLTSLSPAYHQIEFHPETGGIKHIAH